MRTRRLSLHVAVLGLVAAVTIGARYQYTARDTLAALRTASPRAACIVRIETGGTYDPNVIGRQGEIGAAQLHPFGLLPAFLAGGWGDPWSPYDAVAFLDWELSQGHARAWSPVLLGLC